jgi:hypothetical protein
VQDKAANNRGALARSALLSRFSTSTVFDPLSNIRLTTFFAGESEVKIIDPSRISVIEAIGCQVEFIPPMDCTTA